MVCAKKSVWRTGFLLLLFASTLGFYACVSAPEVNMPGTLPDGIREVKSVRVYAYRGKIDTGLHLAKGDVFTVMAAGKIYRWRNDPGSSAKTMRFSKWIGDEFLGSVFYFTEGVTQSAAVSGQLYLGISDTYYDDNRGHFDVTIITWKNEDYIQIADFLEQLKEQNPDHTGIADAFNDAYAQKRIAEARSKASLAISATQKQIKELETGSNSGGTNDLRKLKELEEKLAALQATQAELDQLKGQLKEERVKTSQLGRELEAMGKREKQLIDKINAGGSAQPPMLLVSSPDNGLQTTAGTVRLQGVAEDEQGLEQLDVYINGRAVQDKGKRGLEVVKPKRLNIDQTVPLQNGVNRIRVLAIDSDGLSVEKILTVHRTEKRRNVWAVVVGINNYPRVRKLKYAVNDARAFYDLLVHTNKIPRENVKILLDQEATLKNLRSALGTELKKAAGPDDMVIIFFAGHGSTERDVMSPDGDGLEKYLLPYDSDPNDLYATALPMREIAHIFNRIRSERLIFLADACYSGASGGRTVGIGGVRAGLSDAFLDRIAAGRGKIIISASAANEVSVEKDELQHGVFTYFLLTGLRGPADTDNDGLISVDEAYQYTSDQVTRSTGQEQHPLRKGAVEGKLILGIVP